MRKLGLLIMPLMVTSFSASCGNTKQFTVTFDTDGGSHIESQKVSSGKKATKPDNPTKEQTDIYTFNFNEWQLDGSTYDFNTPVTKDITLKASYNKSAKHYIASATDENKLIFTADDGVTPLNNIDITAGQVFTFKVKANNDANGGEHYTVPSILNISIKGMEPLVDGYKVQNPGEEESEVTIDANKVIGDIVISGSAVNDGEFNYQVSSHYGLEEIDSGSASMANPLTLTFTPESSYTKPKAENIYVYFDKTRTWISPADDGVSDEYCSYDEESGELTIKTDHILGNIDVKARANSYKLLNSLTWGKINELSIIGAAPYVFYIGEEKTVEVNNKIHAVRIIDFNHDYSEIPDDGSEPDPSKVLGISFEFANVITSANGNAVTTHWDNSKNNYNYRKSTLNSFLNNEVLNMLPSSGDPSNPDLREVIKPVDKKVGVNESKQEGAQYYVAKSFKAGEYPKLFPLAHDEMATHDTRTPTGEGVRYQYYKNHETRDNRVKKPVGSTNGASYWLRSPYTDRSYYAWFVHDVGRLYNSIVYREAFAVAPAFCI